MLLKTTTKMTKHSNIWTDLVRPMWIIKSCMHDISNFVKSRNDYQCIPTNRITWKRGDTWGNFHPYMFLMPIRWTVSTSFVKNRTSINLFVDMLQGLISFVRKKRIQPLHKIKKWKVYIEQKFSKQRLDTDTYRYTYLAIEGPLLINHKRFKINRKEIMFSKWPGLTLTVSDFDLQMTLIFEISFNGIQPCRSES